MLIDLHVHSCYSKDSLSRPKELIAWMQRRGLDRIAITDHDAIEGALQAARLAPEAIIVGEEIRTLCGEIIGLFLREFVPPGRTPEETIADIHAQEGLVYVPHPMDRLRGSTLSPRALARVASEIDIVEAYNSRVMRPQCNRAARGWAEERGLPLGAGSDAHRARDIGLATVEVPEFIDAQGLLHALKYGRIRGRLTGPCGRLSALRARIAKRAAGVGEEQAR